MTGIKTTQLKQTMILINTKQANMTLMRKTAVNVSVGRQQTTLHWSSQDTANEVLEVRKTYSFFAHRLWGPTYPRSCSHEEETGRQMSADWETGPGAHEARPADGWAVGGGRRRHMGVCVSYFRDRGGVFAMIRDTGWGPGLENGQKNCSHQLGNTGVNYCWKRRKHLAQWFTKSGGWTSSISSSSSSIWKLLEMQILVPTPELLNQKF